MSERCKTCGASIIWTLTEKGKHMPVDASPCDGNLIVEPMVIGSSVMRVRIAGLFDSVGPRYKSHFATCLQADQHRNKT